eukprot:scaffold9549_cov36-Cyclotella_meneghiniana.AAC.1
MPTTIRWYFLPNAPEFEMISPSSGIQAAKDSGVGSALPMLALHIKMERSSFGSIVCSES